MPTPQKTDLRLRSEQVPTALLIFFLAASSVFAQVANLEWDPNSESDLAGYNIYRSTRSGSGYAKVNGPLIPSTTYSDTAISYGQTYYYVCTAVNDSGLESGYSNEVSFHAEAPNSPPLAVPDTVTVSEDSSIAIPVLANDTDANGDPLSISSVGRPSHGAASPSGSSILYVPLPNFAGADQFDYTIIDGRGASATTTVSITVIETNDPPLAQPDTATVPEDGSVSIRVLANDTDPDSDPLSVSTAGPAYHGSLRVGTGGEITYSPAADYQGTDSFTYRITDGRGGSASATVELTITEVNDSPIAAEDSAATEEDQSVVVAVLANDSDVDDDLLQLVSVGTPSHGNAVTLGDGTVRYTPSADFHGSDSFTYSISDGRGLRANGRVTVQVLPVNDPPAATDDPATVAEDSSITLEVARNDSDSDGDPLTVMSTTAPQRGTVTIVLPDSVRYTPNPDVSGNDSFSYTVSDGQGGSATGWVSVSITPVNDPPQAADDEGRVFQGEALVIPVLVNDTDIDRDSLSLASFGTPLHGSLSRQGDFSLLYTPAPGYLGSDQFAYSITDGKGGSASATVRILVVESQAGPVAIADFAQTPEDSATLIGVLENDRNVSDAAVSIEGNDQPKQGIATVEGRSVRYVPAKNFFGSDSFAYVVTTAQGAARAEVLLTVLPVNDQPVAVDDAASVKQGGAAVVAVLANDSDPDGDVLVVQSASGPGHGSVTVDAGALIRYTPNPGYDGTDSFNYTITDGAGGTGTAKVTITVSDENFRPEARNDRVSTNEDQQLRLNPAENDRDPDGDTLSIVAVGNALHGTVVLASSTLVAYDPEPDYSGSDSFSYSVSDGQGAVSSAVVLVTVTPVNDPPAAQPDSRTVREATSLLVDVLANDTDVDGDNLRLTAVGPPARGTAVLQQNQIRYTAPTGYFGKDSFTYRVGDGTLEVESTVEITIPDPAERSSLVFPAGFNLGTVSYLENTYVGIGVVNGGTEDETVYLTGRNPKGKEVLRSQLAEPLPPYGQTAFLTNEVAGSAADTAAVLVEGESGLLQGFFMIGDYSSRRMDGVGATAMASNSLFFPVARQSATEATLLQMINPSNEAAAWLTMELRRTDGKLIKRAHPVLAPGGSFTGSLEEIFNSTGVADGYVQVRSDSPVLGYEVLADRNSLATAAARQTADSRSFSAPHFFVDHRGEGTELRLLNAGESSLTGTCIAYDGNGEVIAETRIELPANRLTVLKGLDLLGLDKPPSSLVSGSLEVLLDGEEKKQLVTAATFSGIGGKSRTTVPLAASGFRETVFPQVAQSADSSIYTGLAVFNPGAEPVQVLVETYDQSGQLLKAGNFELPSKGRRVDLLNGPGLFGQGFSQLNGHIRVLSSQGTVSFAIFGDAAGEFLSTIEGQAASR